MFGRHALNEINVVLLFWAIMLGITRIWLAYDRQLISEPEGFVPNSHTTSEFLERAEREMSEVDHALAALGAMSFRLAGDVPELRRLLDDELSGESKVDSQNLRSDADQEVVAAAEFLEPTQSGIPGILPWEAFCDQLENTAEDDKRLASLCRRLPSSSTGESSGISVAAHLLRADSFQDEIDLTVLHVLRVLYGRAQLEDRIRRFTERFAPKIRAMEKRSDRMLYNYI